VRGGEGRRGSGMLISVYNGSSCDGENLKSGVGVESVGAGESWVGVLCCSIFMLSLRSCRH
jgi:hypothetical protein